jgi:NADPH:quinone reductase-like Zn-dependent oxidoreductase
VGHLAVQLAKWQGTHVNAMAPDGQEALLGELWAGEFVAYDKTPTEDLVQDINLVLDTFSGPNTSRFLRTLRRGRRCFECS